MFLGLAWYWWIAIAALLVVSIPFKLRFLKWWMKRQQKQQKAVFGKWGEEE